jgi:hypothetical protein
VESRGGLKKSNGSVSYKMEGGIWMIKDGSARWRVPWFQAGPWTQKYLVYARLKPFL